MHYHRIVAKLGTSLLTSGTKHLDLSVMSRLVDQMARLRRTGTELVVVSSGAIAAGRERLGQVQEHKNTPFKQMLASVGQVQLVHTYGQLFGNYGTTVAQALLTKEDLSSRNGYLNARNTLLALIEMGVVCIINENDVVAIDEIEALKFGDNDMLSAMVANLVDADVLALLTNTGGLYTGDPHLHPEARHLRRVDRIDAEVMRMAHDTADDQGTGGMASKVEAAGLATSSGVDVVIADGREPDTLVRISQGEEVGTLFPARVNKMESRKRWLLSGLASRGRVLLDKGAVLALREQNKSLLPAGILRTEGKFHRGDTIEIADAQGDRIGYGVSNYSSHDVSAIGGEHSDRIPELLGYDYGDEVIHRNNLVLL